MSKSQRTDERWFILALLCVPVFLGSLDLTVVSAFLPNLLSELGLSLSPDGLGDVSWVLTSYLLAYSISLFVMGRISDYFGRKETLIACIIIYLAGSGLLVGYDVIVASLRDVLATFEIYPASSTLNVGVIVFARMVAALGAGAITSIAIALMSDIFQPDERTLPLGIIMAMDTVGWLLGAAWGGLLIQLMPWQGIFLVNMPVIIIVLVVLARALDVPRQGHQRQRNQHFDFLGLIALIGTLTSLNIALVNLTNQDTLIVWGALTVICAIAFVFSQLRTHQPLIDLRLMRQKSTAVATFLNFVIGYCIFISLVSVPLLVNVRNLDEIGFAAAFTSIRNTALQDASLQTGVLMAAFTVPLALASVIGGSLSNRLGLARTTLLGLLMALTGFGAIWNQLSLQLPDIQLALLMALAGTGIGLTFAPVIAATLENVSDQRRGMASSLVLGVRMVGMTIATSTLSVFSAERIIDLVIATEGGRFPLEIVDPDDYATIFSTTYITAAVQAVSEMAMIGFFLTALILLPALFLPGKATK